ncbi:MAG TPA: response regulator [Pseudomonadota bacterium]|nr:response regulator [Pseudomonadota bacterium]
MRMPQAPSPEPAPPPAAPAAEGVILVVDDVAINRQVLSLLLRKAGYQVLAAFNAEHALQQVEIRIPDLIMLDIQMPGTDGYTLCRLLLADPKTAKVPIIFLSALDEAVDKVKAFESGGADYVTKPFQAQEVLARVAHQLKIARLQRDLERDKAELLRMNEMLVAAQRKTAMVFNSLSEILPGLVLDGKYRIEERIGSGGFGVVYRATHLGLERPVALKVFRPPAGASSVDALTRFQLEGISACRVNHPNAVTVLDSAVSVQGIPYLVMELLDGPTLYFEIVRKRQLSVRRCLQIGIPLCEVLVAAHAAGIIHRDIKPDKVAAGRERASIDPQRCEVLAN